MIPILTGEISLQFSSVDMPRYKRDMTFVETLTPIVSNANMHAGSASRVSTELLKALQEYATAVHSQGSSTRSEMELIAPLVTSVARYMSLTEESVKEAITFVERPVAAIDEVKGKMKRAFIASVSVFVCLFVLFVISTVRMSTKPASGFPVAMFVIFCSMPVTLIVFMVIMAHCESNL